MASFKVILVIKQTISLYKSSFGDLTIIKSFKLFSLSKNGGHADNGPLCLHPETLHLKSKEFLTAYAIVIPFKTWISSGIFSNRND